MKRKQIHTDKAPAALGPYAQAVKVGKFLFLSGQTGLDPQTGILCEGVERQAHQVLQNLGEVLKQAGYGFEHIVKTTIFLDDMNNFAKVNEIYAGYFNGTYPARSTVQVSRLPKDCQVEIEAIAIQEE